jgi:prevent-host-death family protein
LDPEELTAGEFYMYTSSDHFKETTTVMKATFLDLRRKSKEIVRALDQNQPVTLVYRGKPKGIIMPASRSGLPFISIREHPAFGMWRGRRQVADVPTFVSRLRKNRHAF